MRKLLLAATALTLIGGGTAFAETQTVGAPVNSTTTLSNVIANSGVQSQTQSLGNVITVGAPIGAYTVGGDTQTTGANPISSTASVQGSTVSGASSVSTLSEGNDEEVTPTNTVSYTATSSTIPFGNSQTTGPGGPITATTRVGNTTANSFTGNTTVNAAAVGNNALYSSQSGTLSFWSSQANNDTETASVVLQNTNVAGGALNSEAQAVGNSVSAGGILSNAGYTAASQENLYGGQTANVTFSGNNLLSSGNNVVASAEGNSAALGQASGLTAISQDNGAAAERATLTLSNATVNGDFSAQAAGDVASYDASNGETILNQQDRTQSVSRVNVSGPVDLNAATTFGSLAIGNQFSGTLALDGGTQASSQSISANSTISGVNGGGFGATVNTTATANTASLTGAPGNFVQSVTGVGPTAVANISNASFTGGLTAATAAIGNSMSIK
ncbi:MAG TPA: hypothetical protein VGL58_18040 [Caulobacteraceae bacterium]|jgi:hypothetical protein